MNLNYYPRGPWFCNSKLSADSAHRQLSPSNISIPKMSGRFAHDPLTSHAAMITA